MLLHKEYHDSSCRSSPTISSTTIAALHPCPAAINAAALPAAPLPITNVLIIKTYHYTDPPFILFYHDFQKHKLNRYHTLNFSSNSSIYITYRRRRSFIRPFSNLFATFGAKISTVFVDFLTLLLLLKYLLVPTVH